MDNLLFHNNIVNNVIAASGSNSYDRSVFSYTPPCYYTTHVHDTFASYYQYAAHTRPELFINFDQYITEDQIDKHINSQLEQKIILRSAKFCNEIIENVFYEKHNLATNLKDVGYYVDWFYNKPIVLIVWGYKFGMDYVIANWKNMFADACNIIPDYTTIGDEVVITFDNMFFNELDYCKEYYAVVCGTLNIQPNYKYFEYAYAEVNTNIHAPIMHHIDEVISILQNCHENITRA